MENGQLNAAVAAIKEKGVLSSTRIERSEIGAPGEFDALTDDEPLPCSAHQLRQLGDIGRDPARLDLSMTPASAALYWTVKKGRVGVRAALCFTLLSSLLVVNVVAAWARPLIGKTL